MLEKTIENKIKEYLFKEGVYYFKVHGSKFMLPGIPDIVCCVNGFFLGIEVKAPGKLYNQSEEQKIHEENIKNANGIYLLTDNLEDVISVVSKLKGNKYE